KASWFKKKGYAVADKQKIQILLWKAFSKDALPPQWIPQKKKPDTIQDSVTITGFINGWCPAQNIIYERAKRASEELGKKAVFKTIDTSDRDTFLNWGISDAVYIDKKPLRSGPPLSYKKIKKKILKKMKHL
ncbi:MAG: hypothetical protein KAR07_10195, partial [Spirochaetes bacterium]|nr:hypothetical protein [Spirochaetota bacterium]